MAREFEVVSNPQFRNMHVFLVRMMARTPHIHREMEIGFLLRGNTSLRIGNETYPLKAMDGYLINPLQAHEFYSDEQDTVILAIQISPRIFESFFSEVPLMRYAGGPELRRVIGNEREYAALFEICKDLAQSYMTQNEGYEYDCFAMTTTVLAKLNRLMKGENISSAEWKPIRQRMERMMNITDYIDRNFYRKLLLEEIAEKENLTMSYLSHLFKDVLGMCFQDYLKKKRFEHARSLILGTNRSLLDISIESGYSDPRYLIRMFEDEFGCTPREYRRKKKNDFKYQNDPTGNMQSILTTEEALFLLKTMNQEEFAGNESRIVLGN